MQSRWIFVLLALFIIASPILISCGEKAPAPSTTQVPSTTQAPSTTKAPSTTQAPSPTPTKQYGGTFIYIDPRGPSTTLGWFAEAGAGGAIYTPPMLETLLDCNFSGVISPKLATEWKVADDLKSITLKIRQGVKFHDGSDLTAEVVKWNFDQLITAKISSYAEWSSVDIIDNNTIKINLKSYENTILNTLSSAYIISKKAFDEKGKEGIRFNPVGTGPFKFVKFERDVGISYVKFSDYWQKGKPYVDAIEFKVIVDPMTRAAAFLAGEADAVGGDLTKVEYDLAQKGYDVVKNISGAVCMVPDSANPDSPFAKIKVRQALDYAVDANAIVKARGYGWWEVINQFCPPANPTYIKDLPTRSYNVEKAKQLLTEAGYPNGFKTKIIADAASTDRDAITAMQGFLSKVGIEAEINYADFATYNKFRTGGWNNAILVGAVGFDANLNSSMARYWVRKSPNYPSMIKSDEMEQYYNESRQSKEYDPAKVQKMIRSFSDNVLVIPFYAINRGDVVQPWVHDTYFYSKQSWPGWEPANVWLSAKKK